MNSREAGHLLAMMQPFDQRTVGEVDIRAWQATLHDLSFDDCRAAVIAHYAHETRRVMPADIRSRVKAQRQTQAERQPAIERAAVRQTQPPPEWYELRKRLAARPRHERGSFSEAMQDMAARLEKSQP